MIYIIKQWGLYQNKVTISLASIHNCKMAYSKLDYCWMNFASSPLLVSKVTNWQNVCVWYSVDLVKRLKLRPPENISVLQGQEARIKCDLDGSLKPELKWKKQTISGDVPVPERMVTVIKDSSNNRARAVLKIKFAQMEDSGVYKCVSTLFGKTHVKMAYVTVRGILLFACACTIWLGKKSEVFFTVIIVVEWISIEQLPRWGKALNWFIS